MDISKGAKGLSIYIVIVAQNSRLVSEELTSGGREKSGKKRGEQKDTVNCRKN